MSGRGASRRLRTRPEFTQVLREGRSEHHPAASIHVLAPGRGSSSRLGLVVGRPVGSAVVRNRAKRLVREAFRAVVPHLNQPVDIVVVVRAPLLSLSYAHIERLVEETAVRAGVTDRPPPDVKTRP